MKTDTSISSYLGERARQRECWIVFSGQSDLRFLKPLRRGFKHCFALIKDGEQWLCIDPLASHTDVLVHSLPAAFDLPGWFAARGHKVMKAQMQKPKTIAPLAWLSCVGQIKRVLGLHKPFILTPWQLYLYLVREQRTARRSAVAGIFNPLFKAKGA